MITTLWNPRMAYPQKGGVKALACRLLVGLLVFGFLFEPLLLHAQTRRRQEDRQREEKPKRRRSNVDAFSRSETGLEEKGMGTPQIQVDIGRLSKAAYDAVIRSGRYILGPGDIFISMVELEGEPKVQEIMVGAEGALVDDLLDSVGVHGGQSPGLVTITRSRPVVHLGTPQSASRLPNRP